MAAVALVSLLTPSVEREGASWKMFSECGWFCFDDGWFDRYAFRTAGPIAHQRWFRSRFRDLGAPRLLRAGLRLRWPGNRNH